MQRIDENFTEDNYDNYVALFVQEGMSVADPKTKLAKRVYLIISIFNAFLLLLVFLQNGNEAIQKEIQELFKNYYLLWIFVYLIFLGLIVILPERNNYTRFYVFPIWVVFVLLFTISLSQILLLNQNLEFFYLLMTIHHLIMTTLVFLS